MPVNNTETDRTHFVFVFICNQVLKIIESHLYLFAWKFWAQISSTVASAWNKSEGVYEVGSCTVGTESPEINLLVVVETTIVLLEGIHEYIATVTSEIEIINRGSYKSVMFY